MMDDYHCKEKNPLHVSFQDETRRILCFIIIVERDTEEVEKRKGKDKTTLM